MSTEQWGNYRDRSESYLTSVPTRRRTIDSAASKKTKGPITRSLDTANLEGKLCRERGGTTHQVEGVHYCTKPHVYCMSQREHNGTGKPCGEKSK